MLNRLAKAAEEEVLSWVDLPDVVDWPEVVRAVLRELSTAVDEEITDRVPNKKREARVWGLCHVIDSILQEKPDAD